MEFSEGALQTRQGTEAVFRFMENFSPYLQGLINDLVGALLDIDPEASCYVTRAGDWLGFRVGTIRTRHGKTFARLCPESRQWPGSKGIRVVLKKPPLGRKYADPLRLLETGRIYEESPFTTVRQHKDLERTMKLVRQSYRFWISSTKKGAQPRVRSLQDGQMPEG